MGLSCFKLQAQRGRGASALERFERPTDNTISSMQRANEGAVPACSPRSLPLMQIYAIYLGSGCHMCLNTVALNLSRPWNVARTLGSNLGRKDLDLVALEWNSNYHLMSGDLKGDCHSTPCHDRTECCTSDFSRLLGTPRVTLSLYNIDSLEDLLSSTQTCGRKSSASLVATHACVCIS